MKTNFVKVAGIAEIIFGFVVLVLTVPYLISSFIGQGSVVIMGWDMKMLFGILGLLGLGLLINGVVLALPGKK